jgi:hypothetical protein
VIFLELQSFAFQRLFLSVTRSKIWSGTRRHKAHNYTQAREWWVTTKGRETKRRPIFKIWGFHGGDYEKYLLLGYKNPVRTSQETQYVSATEPSRLMLFKIWGFHGDDYVICCILGYKTSVHTSQETHFVSATETSWLILCKIWRFNGDEYKECRIWCYAMWLL